VNRLRITIFLSLLLACAAIQPAFSGKVYIGADTQVGVILLDSISTSLPRPQSFDGILVIDSSYNVAGVEVFKKGAKASATVISYSGAGHLGKGGSIKIRIDSLQTVTGKMVAVRPLELSVTGKGKKLKAYLMLPLLGYGYFIKGEDATLGHKGQVFHLRTAKFEEINF
jgi:hypothetical protein